MQPERRDAPASAPTPAVDRVLDAVRARLLRLVWMHGLSSAIGAAALWIVVAFLVDWTLHVPSGIRWIHLGVLAAIPSFLLLRELVRPLRRVPERHGIAVLVERAHPDLHELLVSAVDLKRSARPDGDPELVGDVLRRAEARASELELDGVLDARGPRRRFLGAIAACALCALVLGLDAHAAGIFFDRLFGGSSAWPRRTHLSVEIPLANALVPSELEEGPEPLEIRAKVARGQDVPLIVRAEGVVPDEVVLHFKGGQRAVLASTGGPVFRTLLRSLQEDTEFYATGGDDEDEVPWVRLRVLQPPDVASLAIAITPPAYSGLPPRVEFDRDVDVLAGSAISVHVLATPRDAHGSARLQPEDRLVPLVPRPFPNPAGTEGASSDPKSGDPKANSTGLGFDLVAEKSLRMRFELSDSTGLANPDPGLFAIAVVEDRAPEVEVLSPSRSEFDTIAGGLISLRARAEDDFGIASLRWTSISAADEDRGANPKTNALEWRLLADDEKRAGDARDGTSTTARKTPRATAVGSTHVEVSELAGADPVGDGQQYQLVVHATDNATPNAHEGRSSAVRVRVVTPDEFVRRLQDRLARVQAGVNALSELQREKVRRTDELLAVLESDQLELKSAETEIGSAATGQRRVQGDARSLAREVCAVCETVLYARLDERAAGLLAFVDERLSQSTSKSFDPAPWVELAEAASRGELGQGALASKLVEVVGLALAISEDEAQSAVDALARAQQATETKALHTALKETSAHQRASLEKMDKLLELLAEWDNFQSVLGLARDLLSGQKNLQERTKASLKEK